jgi:type VII secretion protein EccE
MKSPVVRPAGSLGAIVAGELAATTAAALLLACGVSLRVAVGAGAALGVVACVVPLRGWRVWQWAAWFGHWLRRRQHRVQLGEFNDVQSGDTSMGVLIDGHTVVTMVSVWGKPYMPTLLKPQHSETPNTLPITVVANELRQAGLGVDVDVICEGARTSSDSYAGVYATFLGRRAAVGQRTTTLVVRLDTRAGDTTGGLLWRRNTVAAAAAATQRIVKALRQANCRAKILTAGQMRQSATACVGGARVATSMYDDLWSALYQPGYGFSTGYYFSDSALGSEAVESVWSYPADHTTLVVALRRAGSTVHASAAVWFTTGQPITTTPAPFLNRFTGRQWAALSATLPGAARLTGLPSAPISNTLNDAVAVGPSGVLIGAVGDGALLMPLSDPAQPTRVTLNAESDVMVRQLIRRAAAAGELVAVYDRTGRWEMKTGSSRIWTTRNMALQPPRPPTMVVHNGQTNPYSGAWISIAVGATSSYDPDVTIEQSGRKIRLSTSRFSAVIDAVSFRNEQPYLN